jgi:hypothetical protein
MKQELCVLYVGYAVFYFRSRGEAGMAAAAMAGALSSDGAASPDAPHIRVTLAPVSPRIECVVLDIPGRARRRLEGGAA